MNRRDFFKGFLGMPLLASGIKAMPQSVARDSVKSGDIAFELHVPLEDIFYLSGPDAARLEIGALIRALEAEPDQGRWIGFEDKGVSVNIWTPRNLATPLILRAYVVEPGSHGARTVGEWIRRARKAYEETDQHRGLHRHKEHRCVRALCSEELYRVT